MNEQTFQSELPPTPDKKKKRLNIPAIIFFAMSLILLTVCIFLAVKYTKLKNKNANTPPDDIVQSLEKDGEQVILDEFKDKLSSGQTVLSLLKEYYPDNIIYVDNGRYIFAEKISTLAKNTLNKNNFAKNDNGEITYSENGKVVSHKGIDISQFQGSIDFSKVAASGIEYAIIRCGYRGYGSGTINEDALFTEHIEGALQNDIAVGVYFFTQAITKEEAVEEADYVINKIKPYNVTYPIVIDVEEILGDTYRQQNLTKDELTDIIVAFCERVKEKGYTPMIYGNLKCLIGSVDLTRLEDYDKWFAYYSDNLYYPYQLSMWQYSDQGSIDGINGNVDLNISFKTW